MIRLFDSMKLANTKLKTRKIRTAVSITISSLLFAFVIFFLMTIQGAINSIEEFSKNKDKDNLLVHVNNIKESSDSSRELYETTKDPIEVKKVKTIHQEIIKERKQLAKDLKVNYDSDMIAKPTFSFDDDEESIDVNSPAGKRWLDQYRKNRPKTNSLKNKLTKYNPQGLFYSKSVSLSEGFLKSDKNGEIFKEKNKVNFDSGIDQNRIYDSNWKFYDQEAVERYLLDNDQLKAQDQSLIPIIAPIGQAEAILGLEKLPKNASAKEKLDRIKLVRKNIGTKTISLCYRNIQSKLLIDQAIQTQKEIKANKDNKDYQKPKLIYNLPKNRTDCLPVQIASDTRSKEEKDYQNRLNQFYKKIGEYEDPFQQKLSFRIVGLTPSPFSNFNNLNFIEEATVGIATMLNGFNMNDGWIIPKQMFGNLANYNQLKWIEQKADLDQYYHQSALVKLPSEEKMTELFKDNEWLFEDKEIELFVMPFGINKYAISRFKNDTTKSLFYVFIVLIFIAAFIFSGTFGKVISDSRRETSIFRALGATKVDITKTYLIYTLMFVLLTILISTSLAFLTSSLISQKFSDTMTTNAYLNFPNANQNLTFSLTGFWLEPTLYVYLTIAIAGLLGMALPLSRNMLRNIIADLKDGQ